MKITIPRNNYWYDRTSAADLFDIFFEEFNRMPSLFENKRPRDMGFTPACDTRETEDHYLLSMDLPGVDEKDINIEKLGDRLVIKGQRHHQFEEKGENSLNFERTYGQFQRAFMLPQGVNQDQLQAHFENGVLSVAIPKPEAEQKKTIPIQTGNNSIFSRLLGSSKSKTINNEDSKAS